MMATQGTTTSNPTSPVEWLMLRQNAKKRFGEQRAGFADMRTSARTAYNRALADILKQYTEGFGGYVSGYGRRGLMNSGIYKQAVDKYAADQLEASGKAREALATQLGDINRQQAGAKRDLNEYLDQIKLAKKVNMMNTAGTLSQASSLF